MTEQFTPVAPVEPEKKGRIGKVILAIVGAIVVVVTVAIVKFGLGEIMAFITGSGPAKAKVGDCMTQAPKSNDMKIVDCSTAEAAYKVAGVVENKTKTDAASSCEPYPTAENYLFQWEGSETSTETTVGRVICLETNQR